MMEIESVPKAHGSNKGPEVIALVCGKYPRTFFLRVGQHMPTFFLVGHGKTMFIMSQIVQQLKALI